MQNMFFRASLVACTGVFALALTGCPGGDGDGDGGTGDCADGEVAHPYNGTCVADCSEDETVCEGATPVCIGAGDAGTSDGVLSLDGLCGCDDTSCGSGEICHPIARVCVEACDPFADGTDAGEFLDCPDIDDEAWACYAHPDASDYVCQPPCATDADCFGDNPVCDDGYCVATCDSADELRLLCPNGDCNVVTGRCGGDVPDCNDTGCTEGVCDVASGECVDCMASSECAPMVCDLGSGNCVACLEDNECEQGQVCDTGTGECVGECAVIGSEDAPCAGGQVCTPGDPNVCEDVCQDETCISDGEQLCEYYTEVAEYNECRDPDVVTGWCDNAMLSGVTREAGGPILQYVDFVEVYGEQGTCGASVGHYRVRIYSATAFDTSLYSQRLMQYTDTGNETFTFSDGPATVFHPSFAAVAGMPDYYDLEFSICEDATFTTYAIALSNNNDASSNVICFESGI